MPSPTGLVQLREGVMHWLLLFVFWDYLEITGKYLCYHVCVNLEFEINSSIWCSGSGLTNFLLTSILCYEMSDI